MSAHCHNCGAVASYGYEITHKSDCPALHQKPPRKRTPEEEAAFRRMLTMPVDEESDPAVKVIKPFIKHYAEWMDRIPDDSEMSVFPRHTMGELRAAIEFVAKAEMMVGGVTISRDSYYSRSSLGNVWLCHDREFIASMIEINNRQIFCTWDQIQDLMYLIQRGNGTKKVQTEFDAEVAALPRS